MARAYSQDLRDRVIDAALAGMAARQAAVRFGAGIATAIVWVRRARETGERKARPQGQPRRSKLDPHRDVLFGLIEATDDISLVEMQERLAAERGIKASVGTIWTFLDRAGLTFKKSTAAKLAGMSAAPVRSNRRPGHDGSGSAESGRGACGRGGGGVRSIAPG